jgi:hypothetical protein
MTYSVLSKNSSFLISDLYDTVPTGVRHTLCRLPFGMKVLSKYVSISCLRVNNGSMLKMEFKVDNDDVTVYVTD